MALITETGTGATDSEVLCSVAFADAYHAAQGNTLWAPMQIVEKEQALRRAYSFMQQTYRARWAGHRTSYTQALDWPRYDVPREDVGGYAGYLGSFAHYGAVYPSDSIPKEIQQANAELAWRAAAGDLLADIEPTVQSERVGPIEVSYFQGSIKTKKYPAVDRLLTPFLKNSGAMLLTRA